MSKILLTGGAGFIGSHTAVALMDAGYDVVIADNLYNSEDVVIDRLEQITGKRPAFYAIDVADADQLAPVFAEHDIDGVIHFAGYKAVGESVQKPLAYYRNNLDTTLTLLETMAQAGVNRFVFSSSATVYGEENPCPLTETMPKGSCSNPYGWTKSMIEQILTDAAKAIPSLSVVLLRYFNPIGAHPSGLIGEDPQGIPNNLMPFITQVAVGKRPQLTVFGDDYDTPDGTCRRDYIHVMDLAEGHVKALEYAKGNTGAEVFNLGTGTPYSVLEVVHAFEEASGVPVPYVIGERRAGDLADVWADADKADRVLGWKTKRTLQDMCRDSWNWQSNNPSGYRG
ncbi:MAG: UDP-glucose 4-epimerase GalE [Firmicutes bacterium]|nr:UDP-glucose 4-epimerase GalE [Bacillota bacterium]